MSRCLTFTWTTGASCRRSSSPCATVPCRRARRAWSSWAPPAAPLVLLGARALGGRLTLVAAACGEWVLDAGFALETHELEAGDTVALSRDVTLEACKTPHAADSLALGVRAGGARLVY